MLDYLGGNSVVPEPFKAIGEVLKDLLKAMVPLQVEVPVSPVGQYVFQCEFPIHLIPDLSVESLAKEVLHKVLPSVTSGCTVDEVDHLCIRTVLQVDTHTTGRLRIILAGDPFHPTCATKLKDWFNRYCLRQDLLSREILQCESTQGVCKHSLGEILDAILP